MTKPLFGIISTTFNHAKYNFLELFCLNMLAQTIPDWKCIILHDGCETSQDSLARESSRDSRKVIERFLEDERFQYIEVAERSNCWGHNLRAIGQELIDSTYLHHTNCDNQYTWRWLEYVLNGFNETQADVLYYNSFHNYTRYSFFDANFAINCCDFVNYVMKTDMAKQIGFPWRDFASDGNQIESLKHYFPDKKFMKINSGLAFHN